MRCELAEEELKALIDDELSSIQRWRVTRHVESCAQCGAELSDLRSLNEILRSADPAPETSASPRPTPRRFPGAFGRLTPRMAVAALLIAALTLIPALLWHRGRGPQSVSAALSHVNTWRLSGWKQIDGKHVRWEIWGRRSPFLFYERVGDDITFDEGEQRLRIYPPAPAFNRPQGLIIRTSSSQQSTTTGWSGLIEPSVESMIDGWNWSRGGGMFAQKPFYESAAEEKFRRQWNPYFVGVNTNLIFTIDRFTMLPKRYELHFQSASAEWDTEDMAAAYDIPIPGDVEHLAVGDGYRTVDLTQPSNAALNFEAEPVALDAAGNIVVRYRARLAGNVLSPSSELSGSISSDNERDELYGLHHGRILTYIHTTGFFMGWPDGKGYVYEIYSPVVPITRPADLPDSLHVALDISPSVTVKGTDNQPPPGAGQKFSPTSGNDTLFQQTVRRVVPLPRKPNTASVADSLPKELNWVFRQDSVDVQAIQGRVDYYRISSAYVYGLFRKYAPDVIRRGMIKPSGMLDLSKPIDASRLAAVQKAHEKVFLAAKHRQEQGSIYWQKRLIAIELTRKGDPLVGRQAMLTLAEFYGEVDDQPSMRRTLHELIAACQKLPEHGGLLRRQAEFALKTGSFPWDADYKGPS